MTKIIAKKNTNREINIELMRVILCIFVIVIHQTADYIFRFREGSMQQYLLVFVNSLTKFAVPGFFFVSGYALFKSYSKNQVSYMMFIKKRIIKILPIYILISLFYYIVYNYLYGETLSLKVFLKQLLFGSASYHLYYIVILIQFYFLFIPIFKMINKINALFIIGISSILTVIPIILKFQYKYILFVSYILYFIIGMIISKHKIIAQKIIDKYTYLLYILFIGVLSCYTYTNIEIFINKAFNFYIINDYIWYIYSLIAILILFSVSIKIENIKLVEKISKYSEYTLDIYLVHPVFLYLFSSLLFRKFNISLSLEFLLALIFITLCSYGIAKIKKMILKKII